MGADQRLVDEIAGDPEGIGYSGMTDLEKTDSLNDTTTGITQNKTNMSGSEIYNQIDETEFLALSDPERQEIWDIIHLGTVNPFGLEATRFAAIFPGGGPTITALQASRAVPISRATEIGLGFISLGSVIAAQ